jgi:hypothetical protein
LLSVLVVGIFINIVGDWLSTLITKTTSKYLTSIRRKLLYKTKKELEEEAILISALKQNHPYLVWFQIETTHYLQYSATILIVGLLLMTTSFLFSRPWMGFIQDLMGAILVIAGIKVWGDYVSRKAIILHIFTGESPNNKQTHNKDMIK